MNGFLKFFTSIPSMSFSTYICTELMTLLCFGSEICLSSENIQNKCFHHFKPSSLQYFKRE